MAGSASIPFASSHCWHHVRTLALGIVSELTAVKMSATPRATISRAVSGVNFPVRPICAVRSQVRQISSAARLSLVLVDLKCHFKSGVVPVE